MTKISLLPTDSSPTLTDYIPSLDIETNTTKKFNLQKLRDLFSANPSVPYKFAAYLNPTSPNLTAGVWTKILLNNKVFDTGSNFDNATNYRFIAPATGFYWLVGSAQIGVSGISSIADAQAAIYKNGVVYKLGQLIAGSGNALTLPISQASTLVPLTAGDYIELFAFCSEGSRSVNGSSAYTYLEGFFVST